MASDWIGTQVVMGSEVLLTVERNVDLIRKQDVGHDPVLPLIRVRQLPTIFLQPQSVAQIAQQPSTTAPSAYRADSCGPAATSFPPPDCLARRFSAPCSS